VGLGNVGLNMLPAATAAAAFTAGNHAFFAAQLNELAAGSVIHRSIHADHQGFLRCHRDIRTAGLSVCGDIVIRDGFHDPHPLRELWRLAPS
jgi:NADH:ubiquinone oxidoreductase subunit 5 (subunit L)/multisubunit Na+/H+ antiporter MnhA subunit